jgi:hypothetical protein
MGQQSVRNTFIVGRLENRKERQLKEEASNIIEQVQRQSICDNNDSSL